MRKAEVNPIEFETTHAQKRQILGMDLYCLIRMAAALLSFAAGLFFRAGSTAQMLLMLLCFLLAAYDVVMKTVEDITLHHSFSTEPLVLLASLAAFVVRLEVDGAALIFLYRLCSIALNYAVERSEKMIRAAVDIRPDTVRIKEDEEESTVERDAVRPGDTVILEVGMVAAVDCLVVEGSGSVDDAALSGSHFARTVAEGDTISAGAVVLSGELLAEAMAPASASLLERSWEACRSEENEKGKAERLAELYLRFFAPVAVALGALITVLLNVVGKCSMSNAIHRSLCVMILLNPAGLIAGLTMTAHAGMAGAMSRGVLFKGMQAIDKAVVPGAVLLDKNGTVTTGKYRVEAVRAQKLDSDTLLKAAAHAAANADTALARAVVDAYTDKVDYSIIGNFVEYPNGLSVEMKGVPVLLGQRSFLTERGVAIPEEEENGMELHVAFAGRYAGSILLAEMPRAAVAQTVEELHSLGCGDVVLLSEDSSEKTHGLARLCGIEMYYSNCSDAQKLARVQEFCDRSGKASALYVGALECDRACLASADLGVILGDLDSPCAAEAKLLLTGGGVDGLCEAVRSARLIRSVFLQGAAAVLGVKLLLLLLALFGVSSQLWFDMLLDGCVAIGAVLNAVRAFPAGK